MPFNALDIDSYGCVMNATGKGGSEIGRRTKRRNTKENRVIPNKKNS